jgi:glutathionylspermidine synthase
MIELKKLDRDPYGILKEVGWDWMLGTDTVPYVTSEVVKVSSQVAESYYEAAAELYTMLVEAGQHVIDHNLFRELGIPANLIELIKHTWEDDRHIHLYSRFDLALQADGQQVKLIECNADTATCLPETAVVQWAQLRSNNLDEASQFNSLHESLVAQFELIKQENEDLSASMLFSTMRGYAEDDNNVAILMEAAKEAGFDVDFAYVEDVEFTENEGIFLFESEQSQFVRFDYWFKLVPWEYIGNDEPQLANLLTSLVKQRKVVILNPAYSLLFQSKYILKVLWDLYPYHPLLLQTEEQPLTHKSSVSKVLYGREGANVAIHEEGGRSIESREGEYGDQRRIYQEYTPFPTDATGNCYQAGVFYVGEPCGLGFRRGSKILDNSAQFVGHLIEE